MIGAVVCQVDVETVISPQSHLNRTDSQLVGNSVDLGLQVGGLIVWIAGHSRGILPLRGEQVGSLTILLGHAAENAG
ncbi:hypothetical protein A5636_12485 [Mycobacterium asiaticum]|uniref:Uncharacterized protein n=1 Tax=Mycobacterium asiaticum TaxID=1790 RepID=A0A1A3MVM9_MYCAS|nr:hypothetical protein A5636_12485 [Mycobacterium asiaticum]